MQDERKKGMDEHEPEHPGDRGWEPEDPMQLSGTAIPGDPAIMLHCVVEEYARMGWGVDQIVRLFDTPFYQGTYGLGRSLSNDVVRRMIEDIVSQSGVMRFRTTLGGSEEPDEPESDGCKPCVNAPGSSRGDGPEKDGDE